MPLFELERADMPCRCQAPPDIHCDDVVLDSGLIADVIVDSQVVLELKAVERMLPLHDAQLMTYVRMSRCRTGLLINFNTVSLSDGIRRRVR